MRLENFYNLFYDAIELISGIAIFVMSALFVVNGITGALIGEIVRGCLPFLVFPQLSTWLPSKMFGY